MSNNIQEEIKRQCAIVDCAIMMDCTGSMSAYIQTCKEKTSLILDEVKQKYTNATIRYAFVGYRDFDEKDDIMDFTEDIHAVKRFVAGVSAKGGDDTCEDVLGGFEKVFSLSWANKTRVLVHFADAPGHGRFYSNCQDNHPHIDPNGQIGKGYMEKLVQRQIKYTFCRITASTDSMIAKLKNFYDGQSSDFKLTQIELGPIVNTNLSFSGVLPRSSLTVLCKSKKVSNCKENLCDYTLATPSKLESINSSPSYVSVMASTISDAIEESVKRSTKEI
jgi:hypothetical protein